ncbi:MAG: site-specific DNA-methyltransferase [Pseudomonadota bacterium]
MTNQSDNSFGVSKDVLSERRQELMQLLKKLAPETVSDGNINLPALSSFFGITSSENSRFGLSWPGRESSIRAIGQVSSATLLPVKAKSVQFESAENLIIEGDNLEVLKALQKSYFGKVQLVFIDPPYNTGKDFIYPDNFSEPISAYLDITGQTDSSGRLRSTNAESSGRYHSKWLSMMYPRLFLARNLLKETGAIFMTIDDSESANLRGLCDIIFGEENFVANAIWQKKYTRANDAKWFSDNHDHVLIYAKDKDRFVVNGLPRNEEQLKAYSNPDNHPKGPWKATPLHAKSGSNTDTFVFQNGIAWAPPKGTYRRFSDETMRELDAMNEIWFGSDGTQIPSRKSFLSEVKGGVTPTTIWTYQEAGHNHQANDDLKKLGLGGLFDNPKPVQLLKLILTLATSSDKEDLILDFFAGSGTTGEACIRLNREDGGNRKFILVQLPEPVGDDTPAKNDGFTSIADITRERIRRVIGEIKKRDEAELNFGAQGSSETGFRAFSLSHSNFRRWRGEPDQLESELDLHVQNVDPSATPEDIVYELLLKAGFPLTTKIKAEKMAGKTVYSVEDGSLLICLDKEITPALIDALADADPLQVICLDEGFKGNDQLKANAVQTFKARAASRETEIVFRTV